MRAVLRDLKLDVGLAGEHLALRRVVVFPADEEVALLGDGDRPDGLGVRDGGEREARQ